MLFAIPESSELSISVFHFGMTSWTVKVLHGKCDPSQHDFCFGGLCHSHSTEPRRHRISSAAQFFLHRIYRSAIQELRSDFDFWSSLFLLDLFPTTTSPIVGILARCWGQQLEDGFWAVILIWSDCFIHVLPTEVVTARPFAKTAKDDNGKDNNLTGAHIFLFDCCVVSGSVFQCGFQNPAGVTARCPAKRPVPNKPIGHGLAW